MAKSTGARRLAKLDAKVDQIAGTKDNVPVLVPIEEAIELLDLAYENLEFDDGGDDLREAHLAALQHLTRTSKKPDLQGKVWLLAARDRTSSAIPRSSNGPDPKQQTDLMRSRTNEVPGLMLFRQNGEEANGWRDLGFRASDFGRDVS